MAKGKNEILLSIALEGDQEVKSKLKAVGDAGKQSLADMEKQFARAGENASRRFGQSIAAAAPLSKVREALAPILEGAGLGSLGAGLAGGAAGGGLIGRIFGSAGPAAALAALTGLGLRLAKVSDDIEGTQSRLRGFGGGRNAFSDLDASAKKLGVTTKDLAPILEDRLAARRRLGEASRSGFIRPPGAGGSDEATGGPSVFQGGRLVQGPLTPQRDFQDATGALLNASKLDKTPTDVALKAIGQLFDAADSGAGLGPDAIRQFAKVSPSAANQLAKSLGSGPFGLSGGGVDIGGGFRNFEELATKLERNNAAVGPGSVYKALAKDFPSTVGPAEAARGASEALEGLAASAKRAEATFAGIAGGPISKGLAKGIDGASGLIDKATDQIPALDRVLRPAEYAPGGGGFIGPVRPEDIARAPQSLGEVFSSNQGDLMGRIVSYLRGGAQGGLGTGNLIGPQQPQNPFGAITDFIKNAIGNPGSLQERVRPSEGPSALQPVPAQPVGQQGGSIFDQWLENLNAKLQSQQENLKITDPAGLGIRGDLEDSSKNVASDVKASGSEVASALSEVAQMIRSAAVSAPQGGSGKSSEATATLAGGGWAIRRFPGGGGVSGPGTSTSDSIPAMLSDGEYVIRASSARKLGRGALDWLNAGKYARGGRVKRLYYGGVTNDDLNNAKSDEESIELLARAVLGDSAYKMFRLNQEYGKAGEEAMAAAGSQFGPPGGPVIDTDENKFKYGWISADELKIRQSRKKKGYADGGAVGGVGLGAISFPGVGAMPSLSAPSMPDIASASPGGSLGHYSVDLTMGGQTFRMMSSEETAKQMTAFARDSANFATGPAPGWAHGS